MKNFFAISSFIFAGLCGPLSAQPASNPVEMRYPGEYAWSGAIQWSVVVNIMDHGAVADGITPNDDAFVSAQNALVGLGGGVLYFPAGDYAFIDSIGLADQVVLRGDPPAVSEATDPDYRPPSRLTFPKFNFVASGSGTDPNTAFKSIGMLGGQIGVNTGLVDLDINRASVFAGGYGTSSENVIILGVRSNNVAAKQPWTVPTPEQEDWQIHPNRFASNISAFAYRNVLVANCMLNDAHYWLHRQADGKDMTGAPADLASIAIDDFEEPGYLIKDGTVWRPVEDVFGGSVPGAVYVFDYTNHYGINVQGSTGEWGAPPWVQPNLFYSGAVIRDNWVYCTMRVKIDASGRGLVVKDNILKDRSGKRYFVDPNGTTKVQNAATLENRGIDWRGHDVLIEGNDIEVFRHLLGVGSYSSVDGEGILHQEVHGTTIDNVTIRGNTANAYIGIWKMPYTRNLLIEDNTLTGAGYLYVRSDTNGSPFPMYNVVVRNNHVGTKGIEITASYFSPGVVSANVYDNIFDGTLNIEDHAIHSGNTKQDLSTPVTVSVQTGAVAIDTPAEGILYADADPDQAPSGETVNFTVLVTTPAVTVERVEFYQHKTLMHSDDTPPYIYSHVSAGARALWSAKIKQPTQPGGLDLYTALLVEADPAFPDPPAVVMAGPDPAGPYVEPVGLTLSADVTPGGSAIDRVEFYSAGTFIGADADGLAPFELALTDVPMGAYSFTAKVWDVAGAVVVSDSLQIEVEGVPDGIPEAVSAAAYSDTEVDLAWVDTSTNADGFAIERSASGAGVWTFVDSVGVATTSYRDSGLVADTAYDYRIRATNSHGSSDPSGIATVSTWPAATGLPEMPLSFTAGSLNATAIQLDWTAGAGITFGYRIESAPAQSGPWTALAAVPGAGTSWTDRGLSPGSRLFYRIQAWNNIGDSGWSTTAGATLAAALPSTFSTLGDPWPIPGRIEFEDYNPGGYFDTSSGNEGSSDYRSPDPVDIGGTAPDLTIGWIATGEWLEHTVIIQEAGVYSIDIGYASPNSTGSLSLQLDGANIAPAVVFANTGAWGTYHVHTLSGVYLNAGHHTLRAYVENSGFNLDYMEFMLTDPASYNNWQLARLDGESLPGPDDNPDGDLHLNVFEMLHGLDPLAADSDERIVAIEAGRALFRFPVAKGVDSLSWNVNYSNDLGQSAPWSVFDNGDLRIYSEENTRVWMEADVPAAPGSGTFFRISAAPAP